jgi:glycosyltransferase involved in cell wall biosynthesis
MNMNLLFLCDHYYPYIGGAEVVNKKIAEYFSRTSDVTVVTKSFKGRKEARENLNGVKIYRTVNVPRLMHSAAAYLCARDLARRADIILSATYASGLAGHWLAKKYNKRSILLVHEILGEHWRYFKSAHLLYTLYERHIVTRPFSHFITFSNYTKNKLISYGIPEEKISTIYHGVDSATFYPRPVNELLRKKICGDAPFVYLYFGRPGGSKGLSYLIDAVPEVSRTIPGSKLVLILSRETKTEYRRARRLIDAVNRDNSIIVLDPMPLEMLPDYVNIADAVVIPSLSEGFGFSAVESCMLGKNVVCTDTGSLPEVTFGKLVTVKKADSHAIANGIIRMYNGDYEYSEPKKFAWDAAFKRYEEVINSLGRMNPLKE